MNYFTVPASDLKIVFQVRTFSLTIMVFTLHDFVKTEGLYKAPLLGNMSWPKMLMGGWLLDGWQRGSITIQ
jgi:hypothetical protein